MFQLDFAYAPAWLLGCVAVAAGLTWLQYRKLQEGVPRWALVALPALRFATLFLLLGLLLEPMLTYVFDKSQPPLVVLLQDDSASMIAGKDSTFLHEALPPELKSFSSRLAAEGVVFRRIAFGRDAAEVPPDSTLRYSANETNLAEALKTVQAEFADANLAAAVVLSDGIITAGATPAYIAGQLQVPVHTVVIGDTVPPRDSWLDAVLYNDVSYVGTETPIQVRVRSRGLAPTQAQLTLLKGATPVGQQMVQMGNDVTATVTFALKLDTPGLQAFTLSLAGQAGERTYRNNVQQLFIQVLENRLSILMIAGGPHPDVGALQAAFTANKRYEVQVCMRKSVNEWYTPPTPALLKKADVLLLHNFPAFGADAATLTALAAEVRARGIPVLTFVGQGANWHTVPEADAMLALQPTKYDPSPQDASLVLTEPYRTHASFPFTDSFFEWLQDAPALVRPAGDWALLPGSTVYGKARIRGVLLDYPMLAMRETEQGRRITFVGENWWRLRSYAYRKQGSFDYFDEWMQSLVQWAHVRSDRRRFRVQPTQRIFAGADAVRIRGWAYDESYKPLPGAEINLTLADSSNRERKLQLREVQPGAYSLDLANLETGIYRYRAVGTRAVSGAVQALGSDQGQFVVGASALEYQRLHADVQTLRQVALRSGGHTFSDKNLSAVADSILASPRTKPLLQSQTDSRGLHRLAGLLALLLSFLSAEWILRKRYGMI